MRFNEFVIKLIEKIRGKKLYEYDIPKEKLMDVLPQQLKDDLKSGKVKLIPITQKDMEEYIQSQSRD